MAGNVETMTISDTNMIYHRNSNYTRGGEVREELIYKSKRGDFLGGDSHVIITNRLDIETDVCVTIAEYMQPEERTLTSHNVAELIGNQNYNTVFTALCSVINKELRVRGILALLTKQTMGKSDAATQTSDCLMDYQFQSPSRPNVRKKIRKRRLDPYVVLDATSDNKVKKEDTTAISRLICEEINKFTSSTSKELPDTSESPTDVSTAIKLETSLDNKISEHMVPEPDSIALDEDSNFSMGNVSLSNLSVISNFSFNTQVLNELDCNIDRYTNLIGDVYLTMPDGEIIPLPVKPEDDLHLATPEILSFLPIAKRIKLIKFQALIDCNTCMQRDEDNCLPIHNAVINNDLPVLWRHCHVLKSRVGTVDLEIDDEVTPLHLSLQMSNASAASLLLRHGADVTRTDSSQRCSLHHAAGADAGGVGLLLQHCARHARSILSEDEELWREEYSTKTDEELTNILGNHLGSMYDSQGYTALMLACRSGWHATAAAILSLAPESVNLKSRAAGETALYLAVVAACLQAENNGPNTKISEDFIMTVKVLMSKGADPNIENQSGTSVLNILSSEYNYPELSVIVTCVNRHTEIPILPRINDICNFMLVKNKSDNIKLEPVDKKTFSKRNKRDNSNIKNKRVKPNELRKTDSMNKVSESRTIGIGSVNTDKYKQVESLNKSEIAENSRAINYNKSPSSVLNKDNVLNAIPKNKGTELSTVVLSKGLIVLATATRSTQTDGNATVCNDNDVVVHNILKNTYIEKSKPPVADGTTQTENNTTPNRTANAINNVDTDTSPNIAKTAKVKIISDEKINDSRNVAAITQMLKLAHNKHLNLRKTISLPKDITNSPKYITVKKSSLKLSPIQRLMKPSVSKNMKPMPVLKLKHFNPQMMSNVTQARLGSSKMVQFTQQNQRGSSTSIGPQNKTTPFRIVSTPLNMKTYIKKP